MLALHRYDPEMFKIRVTVYNCVRNSRKHKEQTIIFAQKQKYALNLVVPVY